MKLFFRIAYLLSFLPVLLLCSSDDSLAADTSSPGASASSPLRNIESSSSSASIPSLDYQEDTHLTTSSTISYQNSHGVSTPSLHLSGASGFSSSSSSSNDDDDNEEDAATASSPWIVTGSLVLIMGLYGVQISNVRKENTGLYEIMRYWVQYYFFSFSTAFSSQLFFMYLCLLDSDYEIYGYMLAGIKGVFLLISSLYIFKVLKNNDKLDWYMISEQMIYFYPLMAICCFHLKLSFLLPWFKSQVAKLTYGFPTIRMYFISSAIQTVELILVIAVLVLYAFYNGGLAELPFSILMSYYLTSGSAILFMFLSCLEMILVYKTYRNLEEVYGGQLTDKLLTQQSGEY